MKVLLASAYFESHRGGIEIVAGRLARELERSGAMVTWLAADATPPPDAADGCGTARAIAAWNVTERRLGFPLPIPGPGGAAAIWREVRAADAVMLHDSLYLTNVVAMLAARWHRKPVVQVQHIAAVPYSNPLLRGLMQAANALIGRPMLRAADQVVFISETVAQQFRGLAFKAPPRLVFNGVDTDRFRLAPAGFEPAEARAALGLPAGGKVALFVGRFVEKKGLHIIERLARRRPDVTFALAGWGPIEPQSWRLPNVHVLSNLQGASLVPLYQSSDAFVLPSTGEGLPLVMQEAMACGLPVICGAETAAADPGASAHIEGVAIDGADHERTAAAFAARLDRVLAERAMADAPVAAEARNAYVLARYSWSNAATTYLAIMSGLVARVPAPAARSVAGTP